MVDGNAVLNEMLQRLRQRFLDYGMTDDISGATGRMLNACGGSEGLVQILGGSADDKKSVDRMVRGFLVGATDPIPTYGALGVLNTFPDAYSQ